MFNLLLLSLACKYRFKEKGPKYGKKNDDFQDY